MTVLLLRWYLKIKFSKQVEKSTLRLSFVEIHGAQVFVSGCGSRSCDLVSLGVEPP